MRTDDLVAIMDIQLDVYPDVLQEAPGIVAQRFAQAPDLALVAEDKRGICGYLFSYRSQQGAITPLDGLFLEPPHSDCLYLHDLAVAPRALKRGIGPSLVKHKFNIARAAGLQHCALVSVQDSAPFWQRLGFEKQDTVNPEQADALESYGVPAVYMQRSL
ncbi:GNAT family N-acetyltransferase [Pseudomonas sp. C27(2019)]|nr:GNAT family N-acetyltransferase [Pseudomonas sp. C27(2019)]